MVDQRLFQRSEIEWWKTTKGFQDAEILRNMDERNKESHKLKRLKQMYREMQGAE